MTLKQWLASHHLNVGSFSPADITAWTDAYLRDEAHKSEQAFTKAFLALQGELPTIDEKGTIQYRDGRTGTYALNEDIQDAILPFLQKHGFALHFETVNVLGEQTVVHGILTHKRGHKRVTTFDAPLDLSGGKNVGQARGSILSYAHRYCTVDLLNLVTRGADTDGAGFRFNFDPGQLPTPAAKATFKTLMNAALDDTLNECWKGLDTSERASVGFECLQYVKELAGYVR